MLDWLLQQTVNGLALGAIYALIALGYTMVYGVLRFINFAHADVLMLGAFAAFYLQPAVAPHLGHASIATALVVILLSAAICACIGMTIEYLAYRPLRKRPRLTVLITAIGVSLFIEFTAQHEKVFGAATTAFPQLLPAHDVVLGHDPSRQQRRGRAGPDRAPAARGLWLDRAKDAHRPGDARGFLQ